MPLMKDEAMVDMLGETLIIERMMFLISIETCLSMEIECYLRKIIVFLYSIHHADDSIMTGDTEHRHGAPILRHGNGPSPNADSPQGLVGIF